MYKQKKVVVTGASRGIGFAITHVLLSRGFSVHMISKDAILLKKTCARLKKYGQIDFSVVDLSSREEIKKFCVKWDEKIYGLINNAGRWAEERVDEPDKNIWDQIMRLNLDGVYFLTKGLQRWIVDKGRIVNISSQLGTGGRIGMGAYAASKHAVIGLTRCWSLELSARGILVNAVCPGWVDTESNRIEIRQWARESGLSYKQKMRQITNPLTLKRFIKPVEVANLVCFLIGVEGSGITGQIYEIK